MNDAVLNLPMPAYTKIIGFVDKVIIVVVMYLENLTQVASHLLTAVTTIPVYPARFQATIGRTTSDSVHEARKVTNALTRITPNIGVPSQGPRKPLFIFVNSILHSTETVHACSYYCVI